MTALLLFAIMTAIVFGRNGVELMKGVILLIFGGVLLLAGCATA